jgi:hypothetical protein
MNVTLELDRSEALLWTILAQFESLAVAQYGASVPALLTPEKARVFDLLRTRVAGSDDLTGSRLEFPIAALLASVTSTDPAHVLIAQGLFLEFIGQAIYDRFGGNDLTSTTTRELCECGSRASARARDIVPSLLRAQIGSGDVLLQAIMTASAPMLRLLDDLGEGIDAYFFDRFGVSFADLMGDVAAELIAVCADLDIDRRKFVAFLTSALMGI